MSARVFHIDDRLDGSSLAQALKHLVPGRSWTDVKRLIAGRHVQIHGNLCLEDGRRLKSGDVVKVWDEPLAKPPGADDLTIYYRDAHVVVVEKPAGVTTQREPRETHAGRSQRQATLDELVQQAIDRLPALPPSPSVQKPSARPPSNSFIVRRRDGTRTMQSPTPARAIVRPVHRLDRDTSGVMLFALSPEAEAKLVAPFKQHAIERAYRAVVIGTIDRAFTIESYLTRDRGDGLRGSSDDPRAPERQPAVTHVRPVETIADGAYSIVECRLETGRTHQIRIHLAEAGHMLCGERTYTRCRANARPTADRSDAPRHALHAARLALTHPVTGDRLTFESPWPRDLSRWMDRLQRPTRPTATGPHEP